MHPDASRQLASWGLSSQQASMAGIFDVPNARALHPRYPEEPALVLPYWDPDGGLLRVQGQPFGRIRRLSLPAPVPGFGKPRKAAKYLQPPGSSMHVYLPPLLPWRQIMADTSRPVVITEGEAKALAATLSGFTCLALGGVWSYGAPGGGLLEELEAFAWSGRDVYIVFDSDAADNPQVIAAEARLVYELQARLNARARVVRLPPGPGGSKLGLDDFLRLHGPEALDRLLRASEVLTPLDAKVIGLNKSLAWIEFEGKIYDARANVFLSTQNLTNGSRWSAIKHVTMGGRNQVAQISVAKTWLTHPHAQRYARALFRPTEGAAIMDEHGEQALNLWHAMESTPGPVEPFLDLCDHVFANLAPEWRDLPLKLFAYKAQNLAEKIPLALVLIGQQGSGKTLWSEIMCDAFAPYGTVVTPSQIYSQFHGWVERSLVAMINEAKEEDMQKGGEMLKALISDLERPMNEKFRPSRVVKSYTQYIITSNNRAVGSFSADDRRMIVVDVPSKKDVGFYERVSTWKRTGGARHLLYWLENYDLEGWRPPAEAPRTAEKEMAYREGLTPVQKLADQMRTATDQTIYLWLAQAEAWAQSAELSNDPRSATQARAIRATIAGTQIRPWYTPEELALMFPAILMEVAGTRYDKTTPVGRLSRELRDAGITYLRCSDNPAGFYWRGLLHQYLIVGQFDEWKAPVSQDEFERYMTSWPTFAQYRVARGAKR